MTGVGEMIGFVQVGDKHQKTLDLISMFAFAKNVPFCHFTLDAVDSCMEGKPLLAKQWNGDTYVTVETELPRYVDRIATVFGPLATSIYGTERAEWLSKHTIILNQRSFHKDELMVAMIQNGLGEYVIPSYYVNSCAEIERMMHVFSPAIIKPVKGKQGQLVYKLFKENGQLIAEGPNGQHVFDEDFFSSYCFRLSVSYGGKILLQPFLDFRYDNDRVLDFRLLRQRGADGSWEDVATYARIGSNAITSNIHAGGSMLWADTALQVIAPEKASALLEEIMMLGEKLPLLVEKYFGEDAFCIGFDIAVDRTTLHPYVMESNLTPGFRFTQYQYADHRVNYYKYLLSK